MKITIPDKFDTYNHVLIRKTMNAAATEMKASEPDIFCCANVVRCVADAIYDRAERLKEPISRIELSALAYATSDFAKFDYCKFSEQNN